MTSKHDTPAGACTNLKVGVQCSVPSKVPAKWQHWQDVSKRPEDTGSKLQSPGRPTGKINGIVW